MRLEVRNPLPFPDHLDIEVTNACQCSCPMCPRFKMKREVGFMQLWLAEKIASESFGKVKTCYLHMMGEPLLHPEIGKIVRMFRSSGIWTCMSTNAQFLTPEKVVELCEAGLDQLIVSMDSIDRDKYELIRRGANFEVVRNNILNMFSVLKQVKHPFKVELQRIQLRLTEDEKLEWEDYWKPYLGSGDFLTHKPFDPWSDVVDPIGYFKAGEFDCTMFNYSLSILWNGDVSICCHDYNGEMVIGNAAVSSLQELWNCEKMRKIRKDHFALNFKDMKLCRGCYDNISLLNIIDKKIDDKGVVPRFNLETISWLESHLNKEISVVETGSGASTIWLARRVKSVISFEDQELWAISVREKLAKENLSNVDLRLASSYSFLDFKNVPEEKVDLAILDGEDYPGSRSEAIKAAPGWVRSGGYILVDDAEREDYQEALNSILDDVEYVCSFVGEDAWGDHKGARLYRRK